MSFLLVRTYYLKTNVDFDELKKENGTYSCDLSGEYRAIRMIGFAGPIPDRECDIEWHHAVTEENEFIACPTDFDWREPDVPDFVPRLLGNGALSKFPSIGKNLMMVSGHYDMQEALYDGLQDDFPDPQMEEDPDADTSLVTDYIVDYHTLTVPPEAIEKCVPESFVTCFATTYLLAIDEDECDFLVDGEWEIDPTHVQEVLELVESQGEYMDCLEQMAYAFYAPGYKQ